MAENQQSQSDQPIQPAPAIPEPAVPPEPVQAVPETQAIETPTATVPEPVAPPVETVPPPTPIPPAPSPVQSTPTPVPAVTVSDLLIRARQTIASRKRKKLDMILSVLQKNGSLTNRQIRDIIHISESTTTRYLNILEKEGKVRQIGTRGNAKYELIAQP